jgi:V8-like Glu-specific endopeptidase
MPDPDPAFEPGDPLIIYQYPCGRELMMAIDTEAVVETAWEGRRLRYRNNTEPGSSGSPVFDMRWNLVALHHAGAQTDDPAGYDPCSSFGEDDPERALAEFNQGIPIANIHAYIKSKKLDYLLGE